MACYFEPLSNCTYDDALRGKKYEDLLSSSSHVTKDSHYDEADQSKRVLIVKHGGDKPRHFFPRVLNEIFHCSKIDIEKRRYWWRAISASYHLRPNKYTLEWLNQHMSLNINHSRETCIGMYVRRGDKHKEAPDKPIENYTYALEKLWSMGIPRFIDDKPIDKPQKVLFFGTEDNGVIRDLQIWGEIHGWRILYTNLFDRDSVSSHLSFTENIHLNPSMNWHHEYEYLSMLLNLQYILKCNAFVCTMSSNYCRIVDELRATVASKANLHYFDVTSMQLDRGFELFW
jgi:hypothetical protein